MLTILRFSLMKRYGLLILFVFFVHTILPFSQISNARVTGVSMFLILSFRVFVKIYLCQLLLFKFPTVPHCISIMCKEVIVVILLFAILYFFFHDADFTLPIRTIWVNVTQRAHSLFRSVIHRDSL
jgi:hypothetical protein